jgi:hypothetical protein
MVLVTPGGPNKVLVDNWKATLNMSFSDDVGCLHFSLVIKGKPTFL